MAKKISAKDIFSSEDIFKGIRDSAKQTIKMMEQLKSEVEKTASALSGGLNNKKLNSTAEIQKVVKVTKQANTLKKEAIQIEKLHSQAIQQEAKANQELEKIEQQKIKTAQQQQRLDVQNRKEKERLQKIQEKQKKTIQDESNAYKRLVKETREAKNESKRLGAEMLLLEKAGKKNSKEYRNLAQSYHKMTSEAKRGDKALKKLDKSVGDNFRNVGNYKGAIQGLIGTLGTLGAGVGIGQIFRNVTGIMIDFDQAQADLSAITGKTKQELSGLTEQAKELGATTQFSATQITEMQIELGKLGFTTEQITKSTQAVSNFASATGSDLASASKVAGASLRMFNLDASEMDRVVSTLGVATTKSALSFADFESAMSNVGPVANSFGFSIEDSVTLLAKLKDAGFEASKGSVAVRNIFLKLADASSPLAKSIGGPVKSMDDLVEAFKKLKAEGTDLGEALELTDARSVSAFSVFLNQADTLTSFKDSITDVNAELEAMAQKRLDSVQGKITLLSSAWEGFILGVDDSTGASEKLKDMIGFLAENLSTIMSVVMNAIEIFIRYQIIVKSSALANRLYTASLMTMSGRVKGLTGVLALLRGGFQKLGQTLQKNIFGVVLIVALELFQRFQKLNSIMETTENNARDLAEAENKLARETQNEKDEVKGLFDALMDSNKGSKERKNLIDEINSRYGTTLKNLEDESKFVDQVKESYSDLIDEIEKKSEMEAIATRFTISQQQLAKAEMDFNRAEDKFIAFSNKMSGTAEGFFREVFGVFGVENEKELGDVLEAYSDVYFSAMKEAEKYEKQYNAMKLNAIKNREANDEDVDPMGNPKNLKKNISANLKEYKEGADKIIDFVKELKEQEEKLRQGGADDLISGEVMNAIKTARETGEARVEIVEDMMTKEGQKRIDFLKQQREDERFFEKMDMEEMQRLRRTELDKELEKKITKIQNSKSKEKEAEITALKNLFEERKTQLEFLEKKEQGEFMASQDVKDGKLKEATDKILKTTEGQINDYNNKINGALEEYAENQNATNDKLNKDRVKEARQEAEQINQIVKTSADFFIQQSQRKIEQIDKEISQAEDQFETFKQLAINGNIDAKESLAEQQRIINEKNKQRLQEEKKQQRLRLAESVFNTYSSKVQANPETALAETIKDTSLLLSFINSIPAFMDGTEDTGKNGQGVDGKGGFHAVLHPNERVVPKSLNDQIGNLSNEDLTKLAVDYKNGRVIERASHSSTALDLSILVNELSDIKQTIKNKPETNIELGEITSSMMEMVKSRKQGNSIVYNRYKIRK